MADVVITGGEVVGSTGHILAENRKTPEVDPAHGKFRINDIPSVKDKIRPPVSDLGRDVELRPGTLAAISQDRESDLALSGRSAEFVGFGRGLTVRLLDSQAIGVDRTGLESLNADGVFPGGNRGWNDSRGKTRTFDVHPAGGGLVSLPDDGDGFPREALEEGASYQIGQEFGVEDQARRGQGAAVNLNRKDIVSGVQVLTCLAQVDQLGGA